MGFFHKHFQQLEKQKPFCFVLFFVSGFFSTKSQNCLCLQTLSMKMFILSKPQFSICKPPSSEGRPCQIWVSGVVAGCVGKQCRSIILVGQGDRAVAPPPCASHQLKPGKTIFYRNVHVPTFNSQALCKLGSPPRVPALRNISNHTITLFICLIFFPSAFSVRLSYMWSN